LKTYQATIRHGSEILLEDIRVYLEETTEQSGLKSWYGVFQLGEGQDVEPGGLYTIQLDDDRSGDVLINTVSISSHSSTQVSFQGTGPLA